MNREHSFITGSMRIALLLGLSYMAGLLVVPLCAYSWSGSTYKPRSEDVILRKAVLASPDTAPHYIDSVSIRGELPGMEVYGDSWSGDEKDRRKFLARLKKITEPTRMRMLIVVVGPVLADILERDKNHIALRKSLSPETFVKLHPNWEGLVLLDTTKSTVKLARIRHPIKPISMEDVREMPFDEFYEMYPGGIMLYGFSYSVTGESLNVDIEGAAVQLDMLDKDLDDRVDEWLELMESHVDSVTAIVIWREGESVIHIEKTEVRRIIDEWVSEAKSWLKEHEDEL